MVSKPYINTIFWNKLYYVQVQQIILKFTFSDNIAKACNCCCNEPAITTAMTDIRIILD